MFFSFSSNVQCTNWQFAVVLIHFVNYICIICWPIVDTMFSILVLTLIYRISSLFLHFIQRLSCVKHLQQQKQQNRDHHTKSDMCIRSVDGKFSIGWSGDAFGRKPNIPFIFKKWFKMYKKFHWVKRRKLFWLRFALWAHLFQN